ncbi:hypothetical protein OAO62_01440 [Gammaproteobacteria bacterium]|nr:hypothetical protein [Gammaproteobacteria bacterium]
MKKIIFTIFILPLISPIILSGEIVAIDKNLLGMKVTYFDKTAEKIQCTAYNSDGVGVSGSWSYVRAEVAIINLSLPDKYMNKIAELDVRCKPRN